MRPGTDLFNGIRSRVFELVAEFDLKGSSAESFGFRINNTKIAYHIKSAVLLDEKLHPDASGRIKMRILVDLALVNDVTEIVYFGSNPAESTNGLTGMSLGSHTDNSMTSGTKSSLPQCTS